MDRLSFYNSILEKEQNRRKVLDDSINLPITIVSIFVGLFYFLFNKINLKDWSSLNLLIILILFLSVFLLLICLYYLTLTFNNLHRGFWYLDFPKTSELFDYDKKLEEFNISNPTNNNQTFDDYLIDKFVLYSDNYIRVNDKRASNLSNAKKILVIILILETIGTFIYFIKIILT